MLLLLKNRIYAPTLPVFIIVRRLMRGSEEGTLLKRFMAMLVV
jgi:hypothetical protein